MNRHTSGAILVIAMIASLIQVSAGDGGYDHGKATGTCTITPSPAAVGQQYLVSATGLSLTTEDDLFILPPNGAGYNGAIGMQVFPDSKGNWSGTFVADDPNDVGKWVYEFDTT